MSPMTDADVHRELVKIRDVIFQVETHLIAKDQMNAALHMAHEVRPTPLASAVLGARHDIERLMATVAGEL